MEQWKEEREKPNTSNQFRPLARELCVPFLGSPLSRLEEGYRERVHSEYYISLLDYASTSTHF